MLARLLGLSAALMLLSGQWSFDRLEGGAAASIWGEIRVWILGANLVFLAAFLIVTRRRSGQVGRAVHASNGATVLGLMTIVLAMLAMSSLWAPSWELATDKLADLAILGGATLALGLSVLYDPTGRVVDAFWRSLILICGLMAVIALSSMASGRVAVLGGGPNVFGRNMAILVIAILRESSRCQGFGRIALWCATVPAAFLVVASGSRGVMVSLMIAMMALGLSQLGPRLLTRAALALPVLAGLSVAMLQTEFGQRVWDSFEHRFVQLTLRERYASDRDTLIYDAWAMGTENPITGAGLSAFLHRYYPLYPHNIFLEVFSDGGLLALMPCLAMMAAAVWGFRRLGPRRDWYNLTAAVMFLVAAQFSGQLYDSRGVFLLAVLVLVPRRTAQRSGQSTRSARTGLHDVGEVPAGPTRPFSAGRPAASHPPTLQTQSLRLQTRRPQTLRPLAHRRPGRPPHAWTNPPDRVRRDGGSRNLHPSRSLLQPRDQDGSGRGRLDEPASAPAAAPRPAPPSPVDVEAAGFPQPD